MNGGGRDGQWLGDAEHPAEIELRKALDEAQLRGPDDVMLRRMWSQVAEGAATSEGTEIRRRRAPRWFWFASGMVSTAAVTLAVSVWLFPRTPTPPGPIASVPMKPRLAKPDSGSVVVAPGKVRTGEGETLRLTLRGGTEAVLGSSSVMNLDANDKPSVEGGQVAFSVPHQPFGHTYVVHAGPYRVIVIGTKFHMSVDGADSRRRVMVTVDDGVVEVWDRTRLARLQRGETWTSPEETLYGTEAATAPAVEEAPAAAARAESPHRMHRAHARTVALTTPTLPLAGGAPAPAHVEPEMAPAAPAVAPAPAPDAVQARAALSSGDVPRALALYRALAQKGGAAGENAEYETGKILRDRMGQPANAVATWRRYRAEHPDGILRIETDVSIIETLVHGGDTDAAITEATDFLRRHPDSERRAEMARVAGDLLRARGDCRRAVSAYQSALSAPRGAAGVAEAATFHRASCLVQLGDPAGAEAARAYLREWPNGRFRAEAARLVTAAVARESEGEPRP